jgi:hypothetical protein
MSEKQLQQLIMLGIAGAAIYYLFFRSSGAMAFPASITVTPENPGLLPPPAQSTNVNLSPGWLTQGVGITQPIGSW